MKKLLVILLLFSNVVYAQNAATVDPTTGTVQTTGNIIDSTQWSNVIRMTSSQLGQVEGQGGGPIPAYNTDTNTIRFSYMPYTVSQIRAIEQVLSGQNLSIVGFNYSWKIYNDLSNCCGTRGSLSVTGQLADKSGKVLESYFYDYSLTNTGANFQTFSGTETFAKSYNLESLGYVGLAWTGQDQNFWSGYYGPRVRESSLSLNYSVKQASTTPTTTTTTTTVSAGVQTPTEIATAASLPPPEAAPPPPEPTNTGAPPLPGPPPPPGSEPMPNNQPVPQQQPSQQPAQQQQPAPNGSPQPASNGLPAPSGNPPPPGSAPTSVANAGPAPQQSGSPATTTGPSLSSVLTTIKNNEKKEQAIAASAVQAANDVAQAAVQATEQTAMSVATTSSNASRQSVAQQVNTVQQNTTQSSSLSQGMPVLSNTQQNFSVVSNQLNMVNNNSLQQVNASNSQMSQTAYVERNSLPTQTGNTQTASNTQVTSTFSDFRSTEAENVLFTNNFLTNRSNPLTAIIENTSSSNNTDKNEQPNTTIKTNVQSNTLAGKIDIASIALIPVGYSSYLNVAIKDTAFYQPKEIYKNQTNVDNTRVLRQMSSDRMHEQMIELQYKGK